MRRAPRARRGFALLDAILGGVILAMGLAVTLTLASRAVGASVVGQRKIVASWLIDELMGMVVVDGPVDFPRLNPTHGRFGPPFELFEYSVQLEDLGIGRPFLVTTTVRWPHGRGFQEASAQTYVAVRTPTDVPEERAPLEPIDRIERWYPEEADDAQGP